ncbi:MAG: hypothetical protein E7323_08615 [Clostridiales bacterium]|nr:hypothetical protein [Clostridiales bacterium]
MHVICVAQKERDRSQFQSIASGCHDLSSIHLCADVREALSYSKQCLVDMAFVYCQIPEHVEAAKQLIDQVSGVQVVLLADDGRYALQAWQIQASGYLLTPYTQEDLQQTITKHRLSTFSAHRVVIQTIPSFAVTVDGRPMHISAAKPRELLALLVDCAEHGLTTAEGISLLWPDRGDDEKSRSLFRVTYKRLSAILEEAGVGDIIGSNNNKRYLHMNKVSCDLYQILAGNKQMQKRYVGQYMQEYSWAEDRNAQLYHMILLKN